MAKRYDLSEKQTQIIQQLTDAGFVARWWGRGDVAERIYFNNLPKTHKCYVVFDDPEDCYGAALKTWVEDCGQHPNWYKTQRQKMMVDFRDAFGIIIGGEIPVEPEERMIPSA